MKVGRQLKLKRGIQSAGPSNDNQPQQLEEKRLPVLLVQSRFNISPHKHLRVWTGMYRGDVLTT